MRPATMKFQLLGVSNLLSGKTTTDSIDFRNAIVDAEEQDLVYMDPPYQGTSFTRDHRYFNGLTYDDFVSGLEVLSEKNISYIISYDGRTGDKIHGKLLPSHLKLEHNEIHAGRSSQSTLAGGNDVTVESLYISEALNQRLIHKPVKQSSIPSIQQKLSFA
jgi:DNA adenine methylase